MKLFILLQEIIQLAQAVAFEYKSYVSEFIYIHPYCVQTIRNRGEYSRSILNPRQSPTTTQTPYDQA